MSVASINSIQSLFTTLFNQPADTKSLADLNAQLDNGVAITKVATDLVNSAAAQTLIGDLSNGDLIDYIYSNAFGRVPDSAGKTYWTGKLGTTPNSAAKAQVIVDIIASAGSADKQVLNSKVDIAKNTTHQLAVQELYVSLLGRAAEVSGRNYWVSQLNNGVSVADIAKAVVSSQEAQQKYAGLVNSQFIDLLYSNAFGRQTDQEGKDYWVGRLNSSPRAAVAVEILSAAGSADRQLLNNKVNVAQGITNNFQTQFALTKETDNLIGTSGQDLFIGDNGSDFFGTVQAGDTINAGAGVDTFKFYYAKGILPTLLNVENVELINAKSNIDFSPVAGSGLKQVTLKFNPEVNTTVAGLQDINFGIDNVTDTDTDTSTESSITGNFGNGTAASVALNDSQLDNFIILGPKVTTLNLDLESQFADGVNKINSLTIPTLSTNVNARTLNITGKAGLSGNNNSSTSLKTSTADNSDAVTIVNASTNTGGVKLSFRDSSISDGKVNFTGGTGNDSVEFLFDGFDDQDDKNIVDGGAGKDTLRLTTNTGDINANEQLKAINAAKNFEILGLEVDTLFTVNTVTVDASKITAVKEYDFLADTVNLSGAATGNKFTLNKTADNDVALNLKGKGQTADLTLKGKVEILNLDSSKGTDTGTEKNEITKLTTDFSGVAGKNTPALTINLKGDKDLKIAAPTLPGNAVTGLTLDAYQFGAKLEATGTALNDKLTGGISDNTLNGGAGDDTIILAFDEFNDKDIIDGGTGTDTLRLEGTDDATKDNKLKAINAIKGIDLLGLVGNTVTVDASKITSVKEYDFVADTVNLSGAATGNKFTLNKTADNDVALKLKGKGQTADLTLKGKVQTLELESSKGTDTGTEKNEITNLTTDYIGFTGATPALNIPALTIKVTGGDKDLKIAAPTLPGNAVTGLNLDASPFGANLEATGTALNDTLTGGTGDNTLNGGDGDDTIILAFADFNNNDKNKDIVDGGTGTDTLRLTSANEINATTVDALKAINGIKGIDLLGFDTPTKVTVDASKITTVKEYAFNAGEVILSGAATDNKFTLSQNNSTFTLTGAKQSADLTLKGVTNLTLKSDKGTSDPVGANKVTQLAANGNLTLTITGNRDLEIAAPTLPNNSVFNIDASNLTGALTATGTALDNTLTGGAGKDSLDGGAGKDSLDGGAGADTLTGGAGNDTLTGGTGGDTLTGGAGNDIFVYTNPNQSNRLTLTENVTFDTITDFTQGQDKIQLTGLTTAAQYTAQNLVQTAVNASGQLTLNADLLTAAKVAIGQDKFGAFVLGGNTYILGTNQTPDLGDDLLVKLAGSFTLVATNATTPTNVDFIF